MSNNSEKQDLPQYQQSQDTKSLGATNHVKGKINLSAENTSTEQEKINRILRQPRSKMYLDLFEKMDILSSTDEQIIEKLLEGRDEEEIDELQEMSDEEIMEEIRESFLEEFQELKDNLFDQELLGVISKCYIEGCDVHAITPEGTILDHFQIDHMVPDYIAKGRKVYHEYPSCTCVEIYRHCCRVIHNSGEVLTVMDSK